MTLVNNEWEYYKEYFDIHSDRLQALVRGILMNKTGTDFSFIHKTILEYFGALAIKEDMQKITNL